MAWNRECFIGMTVLSFKLVFSWYVEVSVEYEGVLQLTTKGNLLRACIVATEAVGHFCLMEDACRRGRGDFHMCSHDQKCRSDRSVL